MTRNFITIFVGHTPFELLFCGAFRIALVALLVVEQTTKTGGGGGAQRTHLELGLPSANNGVQRRPLMVCFWFIEVSIDG